MYTSFTHTHTQHSDAAPLSSITLPHLRPITFTLFTWSITQPHAAPLSPHTIFVRPWRCTFVHLTSRPRHFIPPLPPCTFMHPRAPHLSSTHRAPPPSLGHTPVHLHTPRTTIYATLRRFSYPHHIPCAVLARSRHPYHIDVRRTISAYTSLFAQPSQLLHSSRPSHRFSHKPSCTRSSIGSHSTWNLLILHSQSMITMRSFEHGFSQPSQLIHSFPSLRTMRSLLQLFSHNLLS